jgi:RNA polymerase sigma factor (sigma-70 family)
MTGPDPRIDELLAIRCQLGEAAAFDELIERWHAPLWGYVRRLLASDDAASEVLQEVWVRVIRGIARLRDGSKLRAWLFGVTRRTMMDRLRDQYLRAAETSIELHDIAAEPKDETNHLDLEELDRALETLPVVEREVLTLFYLNELSLGEVAEALNVPVGTVKSRLFRARRLLRLNLNDGEK